MYKAKSVLIYLPGNIRKYYTIGDKVTIDEAVVVYCGKLSFTQYIPGNPIDRDTKIWVRVDAITGYIDRFEVYLGKAETVEDDGTEVLHPVMHART